MGINAGEGLKKATVVSISADAVIVKDGENTHTITGNNVAELAKKLTLGTVVEFDKYADPTTFKIAKNEAKKSASTKVAGNSPMESTSIHAGASKKLGW